MLERPTKPCVACEMFEDFRADAERSGDPYDRVRWQRALLRHQRDDHGQDVGALPAWPTVVRLSAAG